MSPPAMYRSVPGTPCASRASGFFLSLRGSETTQMQNSLFSQAGPEIWGPEYRLGRALGLV